MKNNTKIRLHLSKQLFESLAKQVLAEAKSYGAGMEEVKAPKAKKEKAPKTHEKVEEMETKVAEDQKEKTIQISLNEYTGSPAMLELGQWVVDNYPKIADAINASTAADPGQRLVDLGNQVLGLATVGTAAIGISLAIVKDDIKKAALKVKSLLTGKKGEMKEGDNDAELAQILTKIPDEQKQVKEAVKKEEE